MGYRPTPLLRFGKRILRAKKVVVMIQVIALRLSGKTHLISIPHEAIGQIPALRMRQLFVKTTDLLKSDTGAEALCG